MTVSTRRTSSLRAPVSGGLETPPISREPSPGDEEDDNYNDDQDDDDDDVDQLDEEDDDVEERAGVADEDEFLAHQKGNAKRRAKGKEG
jgi:hypothetical protein